MSLDGDHDHDHDGDRDGDHDDDRDPDPRADRDAGGQDADAPSNADRWPGTRATYAINWKIVLAVDAAMGLAVVAAGLIALVVWNFWVGAFLMAAGCAYTAMVAVRADRWRRLRREAGL